MNCFITPLDVKLVSETPDGKSIWKLDGPLVYHSDVLGVIAVPEGFVTDYASVPRIPLAYLLCGGVAYRPAVLHDYMYSGLRSFTRAQADAMILESMECIAVPWWRRRSIWLAVRAFGWQFFKSKELDHELDIC